MEKYVTIETENGTLRGMLHLPEGNNEKGFPGVILYHGFSGNRMEPGFMFVRFSRLLAENGIASIRFDFLGSGESDGSFSDMTFSKEAEQASLIFDYFRGLSEIDESRVLLLGLSMGGAIAGYTAGTRSDDLSGLVLWAPAGEMRLLIEKKEEMIKSGEITGDIMDIGGLQLGEVFIDDIKSVNIMERTSGYSGKTLIIHGTGDNVVPHMVSLGYKKLFGGKAELVLVDDADHTFQGIPWINKLFAESLSFIKEVLK